MGTAQSVAAEVSELTIPQAFAAIAIARARVNGGHKGVRIEPLNCARLRHTGNRMVVIKRYASNDTCELRSTTLHDAASFCRIGRAEHGKRNATVPEDASGHLPAVQRVSEPVTPNSDRQLIDILSIEIVSDVVVARAIIASQLSRKRGEDRACGKLQESAV